ncbi:MAG TPA: epoxide hydrolase [Xanthobacteraceae bacterium]|jgi:microsomal epoxide hydrolase
MADRRTVLGSLAAVSVSAMAGRTSAATAGVRPFRVAIDDGTLDWVSTRVRQARPPVLARGTGSTYGVDADWFAQLLAYWRHGYDWRQQAQAINRLPQFTADVMGRRLHFVHQRSTKADARPLLLLHGWPYSFWTFSEVIAPLARDFHVVVPSLPGFGFSDPIDDQPRGLRAISQHIHALMTRTLGYDRYFVQGSDFGAVIADWLAMDVPDALLGEQTNLLAFRHAGAGYGKGTTGLDHPTPAEERFVADEKANFEKESAYFMLQATRPETLAYAMADSPVGVAAYLLDKWQRWTDTRERTLDQIYGRDRLLTEVMLYAATGRFATSIWPYAGFAQEPFSIAKGTTIDVPFGLSAYPDPLNHPPPREFAAHSRSHIVQWEVTERGGHFPALEDPARFVERFRAFAAVVRGE